MGDFIIVFSGGLISGFLLKKIHIYVDMEKKKIECYEYNILLKQLDDHVSVVVNGEDFMLLLDCTISELDDKKIIDFASTAYEKWGFGEAHYFPGSDFITDGSSCKDSRG
jgi:hypothetical protein